MAEKISDYELWLQNQLNPTDYFKDMLTTGYYTDSEGRRRNNPWASVPELTATTKEQKTAYDEFRRRHDPSMGSLILADEAPEGYIGWWIDSKGKVNSNLPTGDWGDSWFGKLLDNVGAPIMKSIPYVMGGALTAAAGAGAGLSNLAANTIAGGVVGAAKGGATGDFKNVLMGAVIGAAAAYGGTYLTELAQNAATMSEGELAKAVLSASETEKQAIADTLGTTVEKLATTLTETADTGTGTTAGLGGNASFSPGTILEDPTLALGTTGAAGTALAGAAGAGSSGTTGAVSGATGTGATNTATGSGVLGTGLSGGQIISALPTVAAVIKGLTGGNGDQTVSTTSTTDSRPAYIKQSAEKLWNDFIDDFYGTSGGKSVKDRENETANYKATTGQTYLNDTTTAMQPYLTQLSNLLNDANNKTGYFTPVSFGFGGQKMAEFVPKANRDLVTQLTGIGQTSANTAAGLAELKNKIALENLPNAGADSYSNKLAEFMKYANTGSSTSSSSANVPGTSTWTDILNAITSGVDIYSKLYPWQKAATNTP